MCVLILNNKNKNVACEVKDDLVWIQASKVTEVNCFDKRLRDKLHDAMRSNFTMQCVQIVSILQSCSKNVCGEMCSAHEYLHNLIT